MSRWDDSGDGVHSYLLIQIGSFGLISGFDRGELAVKYLCECFEAIRVASIDQIQVMASSEQAVLIQDLSQVSPEAQTEIGAIQPLACGKIIHFAFKGDEVELAF